MKDPIRVLALILLIALVAVIDMCSTTQQQREFDKYNTHPDTVKRDGVRVNIC